MNELDDGQLDCTNMDDGELVFAPRWWLTEEEKERADLHFGGCAACQADMDYDHFFSRLLESTWETYAGG